MRVRRVTEMYGFRFADITARFQDYDLEIDLKILLDTLQTDSPALPKELNDKLFYTILEDYEDIPTKAGKMKKMKVDPHYNVVQVKYAYAVTCHKVALHGFYPGDPSPISGEFTGRVRRMIYNILRSKLATLTRNTYFCCKTYVCPDDL